MGRVIALSGWKGSGKDTVAEHLVREHGYVRMSFADYLKDMVSSQYGVIRSWLDNSHYKESPLIGYPVIPTDPFTVAIHSLLRDELSSGYWTPRALCILEGSVKRSVYSNYWVRGVVESIRLHPERDHVISDLRYRSEIDTLRMVLPDVLLVRVRRGEAPTTADPSERDLDQYPFLITIDNGGTRGETYEQVDRLLTAASGLSST